MEKVQVHNPLKQSNKTWMDIHLSLFLVKIFIDLVKVISKNSYLFGEIFIKSESV